MVFIFQNATRNHQVDFRFIENLKLDFSFHSVFILQWDIHFLSTSSANSINNVRTMHSYASVETTVQKFIDKFTRVQIFYCSHFEQNTHYYIYFDGRFLFLLSFTFILMCRQRYSLPFQMCIFLVVLLSPLCVCSLCRVCVLFCFISLVSYINVVRIWFDTSFCLVATFIAVYCFYFHLSVLFFCTICCSNIIFRTVSLCLSLRLCDSVSCVYMILLTFAGCVWKYLRVYELWTQIGIHAFTQTHTHRGRDTRANKRGSWDSCIRRKYFGASCCQL